MPRLYAVPYNTARMSNGKKVGLDAYFWTSLEKPYRAVLLVQPADRLQEAPPPDACPLPARVDVWDQVRLVQEIAAATPPPLEAPRPSLLRRLAELLVPAKLLAMGEPEARVPEEAQARSLARLIAPLEPLGETLWAVFTENPEGILPRDPEMARIYQGLRSRDPGYLRAEEEARNTCS